MRDIVKFGEVQFFIEDIELYTIFYKSNRSWWSPIIKWWTSSPYSHCETLIRHGDNWYLMGISDDQRVRIKSYDMPENLDKWELINLTDTLGDSFPKAIKALERFYNITQGKKYDWKGILLSYIFNRSKHNKNKYTCSEWCGEWLDSAFDIYYPKQYIRLLPNDIYNTVNDIHKWL